jgi:3-phosphoshikimate 1-carboxyvinyltransferase
MVQAPNPSTPLAAERSPWLRGSIRLPGDPVQSRLSLIAATLARGETVIDRLSESATTDALIASLRAGGGRIERVSGRWHVQGLGLPGPLAPLAPLELAAAGAAAPLLVALFGGQPFATQFSGLAGGAGEMMLAFLAANGTRVGRDGDNATTEGPRFAVPFDLAPSAEAHELVQPLLLHGLLTTGRSRLRLPPGAADPAEALLAQFGAEIEANDSETGREVTIEGLTPLRAQALSMSGDAALAVYPLVAALIAPDSEVTVEGVSLSPGGLALLDALKRLGGDLTLEPVRRGVADIVARHGTLTGAVIPADLPIAADDFAILAVAAAFAEGETLLCGLREGHGRFALTRALRDNGVDCVEQAEGLIVRGQRRAAGGGKVAARLDPKLAMSFLVFGMASDRRVSIEDSSILAAAFPGFVSAFEHIGASFSEGEPS